MIFLDCVLWLINHCRLFITKSSLYIYIIYISCGSVFLWHKTIVGYLMANPVYAYILNIYDLVWCVFYGISIIEGYLLPNLFYPYILNVRRKGKTEEKYI